MKELVFGHKNPDTDAIVAAKAYSYLQNKLGADTEAVALGEPNEETQFVLDYFKEPAPRVIKTASNEVDAVMLIDHNEAQQSVDDIKDVQVTHVVDHHRIANFETSAPLYYHAEPLGCSSTIILKEFKQHGVEVPANIAGMMLSAIISDTLLLKSPTTTDEDVAAVKELAKIAGVDYEKYGLDMLKAGTNLASKSSDPQVADYVLHQEGATEFLRSAEMLLHSTLHGFRREGKSFVTVAVGCTGGHHRSVAVVEELGRRLASDHMNVKVSHRDLER